MTKVRLGLWEGAEPGAGTWLRAGEEGSPGRVGFRGVPSRSSQAGRDGQRGPDCRLQGFLTLSPSIHDGGERFPQ